jgi:hypothetical protein
MSRSQRRHPRYAYRTSIAVRIGGSVLAGHMVNISRGGLCAAVADPVPPGTAVAVDIQLAFDDGPYSEPLRLSGHIVRCTASNDAYQVGLAFDRLDTERALYLMIFLRYLDRDNVCERSPRPATVDERFY